MVKAAVDLTAQRPNWRVRCTDSTCCNLPVNSSSNGRDAEHSRDVTTAVGGKAKGCLHERRMPAGASGRQPPAVNATLRPGAMIVDRAQAMAH
ncbi:hypothetical protein [Xanthomonas arboricola]|uniref:hypothetical protein n=1 Tax=Xanthomonas arboricola TaxID=56448 RepID=UPI00141A8118|nr:hypothetical protein [Xanthomonas arboricola]NIK53298.1 hypothetical protein [Xanthomonas arboricola]